MENPKFLVNGVDILPFIEAGGLKWTENDVDSPQAGRTLDGLMHRGRVTQKKKLEIKCIPLTGEQTRIIYTAIGEEYTLVEYDDPKDGHVTREMYNSTRPGACLIIRDDGVWMWDDIAFSLIER